jgi:D-alanyl-D-alanine carboxypeptidase
VRAKTGTLLEQVSALSGWVWPQGSREPLTFSILSRGLEKAQAIALEDQIVAIVSTRS